VGAANAATTLNAGFTTVRLVGDRLHLLQSELLSADAVTEREDSAGRTNLDHFGAIFVQPAHLLARVPGPADNRWSLLVVIRRQAGVVAVAAGRTDRIGRGDDPRTLDPAAVDRLLQRHVVEILRADVAHGRETGIQGRRSIGRTHDGPEIVGIFEALVAADLGETGQVDVHVDEAGEQGLAGKVDLPRARRKLQRGERADLLDMAVIADQDRGMVDIAPGRDIEHAVGGDDRRRLCGGGADHCGGRQNPLPHLSPPPRKFTKFTVLRARARGANAVHARIALP
jgi:hypothetical protein